MLWFSLIKKGDCFYLIYNINSLKKVAYIWQQSELKLLKVVRSLDRVWISMDKLNGGQGVDLLFKLTKPWMFRHQGGKNISQIERFGDTSDEI